jgi:hypothetical protein
VVVLGCDNVTPPAPTASEVALRATIESLRDELEVLRVAGRVPGTPTPVVPATPAPTSELATRPLDPPTPGPTRNPDTRLTSRLFDWKTVGQQAQVGDLELTVDSVSVGPESYGGVYGTTIAAGPDGKIMLADVILKYNFRPGRSPYEIHVDFFVVADAAGLEYRGLPVPPIGGNAMPDRLFLSSGQSYRGVIAFILPRDMRTGRLYFTNFLDGKPTPDRLTVNLDDLPMPASSAPADLSAPTSARIGTLPGGRLTANGPHPSLGE